MSNFLQRTFTGGLFGILVYGSLFAGKYSFLVFYVALLIISLLEFYKLTGNMGVHVQKYFAVFTSVSLFVLLFGFSNGYFPLRWISVMVIFPVAMMIIELYRKKGKSFDNLAWTFYGIIYIAFPLSLLNLLVFFPGEVADYLYNPGIVAGVFILVMINDTVAYLIGTPFGRTRLFKRVSPNKSWEGTVGGALVVLPAAFLIQGLFPVAGIKEWLGIALIVSVFGVFGDLVESQFKRELDIKDSGSILPGHGGVLDRIDAWFFVIPAVWVFLNFI